MTGVTLSTMGKGMDEFDFEDKLLILVMEAREQGLSIDQIISALELRRMDLEEEWSD